MDNEQHYIQAPTFEDKLREKHRPGYNHRFAATRRYQLAKPLLRLWEWALGAEVAGSVGKALLVGHKTLMHTRIRFADEPNTHPQDREAYEAEIERLNNFNKNMIAQYQDAREAAQIGENLARALRRADRLLDADGGAIRDIKPEFREERRKR